MRPILASWGPFTIYSYGLTLAVGFLLFLAYVRRQARAAGIDAEAVTNTAFAALVGGIAGARLLFVALDPAYFAAHPVEIFLLNQGGLVWYGGFAGGVLAAVLHARHRRLPLARVLDIFTPPLALAQATGRIGCFLNGCCYGVEAHPPLGVCLPDGSGCRFPVQLLNTALLLALFFALHRLLKKNDRPGNLIFAYGIGYGFLRFVTEFFRGDQHPAAWGLTLPQLISIGMVLVSSAALAFRRRQA